MIFRFTFLIFLLASVALVGGRVEAAAPGLEILNFEGSSIGDVLVAVYKFALGLVGISALVMFVLGAVIFMSAGDSKDRVGEGRKYMTNAVGGLVLALLSWVILYTINPDLVKQLDLRLVNIERANVQELSPEAKAVVDRRGGERAVEIEYAGNVIDAKQVNKTDLAAQREFSEKCKVEAKRLGKEGRGITDRKEVPIREGFSDKYDLICVIK